MDPMALLTRKYNLWTEPSDVPNQVILSLPDKRNGWVCIEHRPGRFVVQFLDQEYRVLDNSMKVFDEQSNMTHILYKHIKKHPHH